MKILVVGGAGFIGSHLVDELMNLNYEVDILDNFSSGNLNNLTCYSNLICEDANNLNLLNSILPKYDVVFNLAANSSIQKCINDPIESNNNNLNLTLNLLEACYKNKIKKFIFSSSASVYGDIGNMRATEDMKPNPLNPYAIQKIASEYYAKIYYQLYGLETVCLRYFNIFGKRQDKNSVYSGVITNFINKINNNEPLIIYGDGSQSRDFCHVSNVVNANILAMKKNNIGGMVFNIGIGQNISINELIKKLEIIFNKIVERKIVETRNGEIKFSCANIEMAKKYLNYLPICNLEKGLKDLIFA